MMEFFEMWEKYIQENYRPYEMTCEKLSELYKIADIMKDLAKYYADKEQLHNTIKR